MTKISKFGGERPYDLLLSLIKRVDEGVSSKKSLGFILGMYGRLAA